MTKSSAKDLRDIVEERRELVCGIAADGSTEVSGGSAPCPLTTLAQKAAGGDKGALAALLTHEEFQQRLEKICQWLHRRFPSSGGYCDWQDLQQDVNRIVLGKIKQFRAESSILTFVSRIARNIHFSYLRKERMERGYIGGNDRTRQGEDSTKVELQVLLQEAVSKLSARQRYVLMRKLEGAKLKDISQEMSRSVPVVCSVLKQAERQLVKCVKDEKRKRRI